MVLQLRLSFPRGHLATFGEIWGCSNSWGNGCYWLLVGRGQEFLVNNLAGAGQPPGAKSDPAQDVSGAQAGTSCAECYLQWVRRAGVGTQRRAKCQVQRHGTGARAHARRMLPTAERRRKLSSLYPLASQGDVSRRSCHLEGAGLLLSLLFQLPPRFWLGTPEAWEGDAIILNKPNAVIKRYLEAFNF